MARLRRYELYDGDGEMIPEEYVPLQERGGKSERRLHDDGGNQVGHDMEEYDPERARALGAQGLDIRFLFCF